MKFTDRVKNAIQGFNGLEKTNNDGRSLARDFLLTGAPKPPMVQGWSEVQIKDEDMYTGYSYAAINKRANRAAVLGKRFLFTSADNKLLEASKAKDDPLEHPYLKLIRESKDFTEKKFWHDISTYLDLEGIYYLMAVRAISKNKAGDVKVGAIQKFVMLNPYQVKRVRKEADGSIGGYIESRDGLYREIPKEMIIEIRLLNPFNQDEPYSMTDAAKDSQFTMKQAGDYTRHSINGNINAPGAISTDVILEDQIFENFVNRIRSHTKGEPLYGNGAGAINWTSMQIDLDKASLDKINEIHRSTLFSVSGVSKTMMGIEESGTGREVSKTQRDDFTENAVMPQIEDIIDALNLDYRKWYPEWEKNKYEIILDNPLESDRDAELKDIEIREREYEVTNTLLELGYEYEIAAKYAHGDITLYELGEPTLEPEITDEEADIIAQKQMGVEPKSVDEGSDDIIEDEESEVANKSVTSIVVKNGRFVKKEHNEKVIKQAITRLKKKLAEDKKAEKEAKAKAKEEAKKVEEAPKEEKADNQIAAKDYPQIYKNLDINFDDLGCIMINTEKVPVAQYVENAEEDLVTDEEYPVVSEHEPHVTLLYGLLENGNVWKDKVDALLEGWSLKMVVIEKVGYFDMGDKYAIVGLVEKTPELIDGHERLTLLPHVKTFSEYVPHITLAYIKKTVDPEKWIEPLAKRYNGQKVATKGVNYGYLPETKSENNLNTKESSVSPLASCISHDCHEHEHEVNSELEAAKNALDTQLQDSVFLSDSELYKAIANLEGDVANAVMREMLRGNFDNATEIIEEGQVREWTDNLALILAIYYLAVYPVYAKQQMANRAGEYNSQGIFAMTDEIEQYIQDSARNAATSHIATILGDFTNVLDLLLDSATERELTTIVEEEAAKQNKSVLSKLPTNPNREDIVKAVKEGLFNDQDIYQRARDLARTGAGLDTISSGLRKEYDRMKKTRAKTIANHESNRVFNMAQYQADLQFLKEANLLDRAYKVLRNRANDPCPVCAKLIEESRANPIPFQKNFQDLGSQITATYTKKNGTLATTTMAFNYEPIAAGNVHVNCRCTYVLMVKSENGTWLNSLELAQNYNPNQPRDSKGRWAATGIGAKMTLDELYAKYDGLKDTLDTMDSLKNSLDKEKLARLDADVSATMRQEREAWTKVYELRKKLEADGKTYYEIENNPEYQALNAEHSRLGEVSRTAWDNFTRENMRIDKGINAAKEALYQRVYGDNWESRYASAYDTLNNWGENAYNTAKAGMQGENYGNLELEHALTQAYFQRKGQNEVDIMWGAYGKAAASIIDGKSPVRKAIMSVTDDKAIAESYASMSRMTSGTKKLITNKTQALPTTGVVVSATVPVEQVIVSHQVVATTGPWIIEGAQNSGIGGFLQRQNEYIIEAPSKADTSNYYQVPTDDGAQAMQDGIMAGKKWSEVI